MRYNILGSLNLIIAAFYLIFGYVLNFVVYPQLTDIYQNFQVTQSTIITARTSSLLLLFVFVLIGLINIYFGVKLIKKSNKHKDKLFTYGVITVIVSFLAIGVLQALASLSIIMPMYQMTEAF